MAPGWEPLCGRPKGDKEQIAQASGGGDFREQEQHVQKSCGRRTSEDTGHEGAVHGGCSGEIPGMCQGRACTPRRILSELKRVL